MLLHCETEGGGNDTATLAASWLPAGTLDSLTELNELCLALLTEQSAVRDAVPSGLLHSLGELWRGLDGAIVGEEPRERDSESWRMHNITPFPRSSSNFGPQL